MRLFRFLLSNVALYEAGSSRLGTAQRWVNHDERFLRIILPILTLGTLAAPLVDAGVASASLTRAASPIHTVPDPVEPGGTAAYTGISVTDSSSTQYYLKLTAYSVPSGDTFTVTAALHPRARRSPERHVLARHAVGRSRCWVFYGPSTTVRDLRHYVLPDAA